ncbi:MBL fold metallo-hydrolase [Leptolyngbya sp. AN02str]|uniref:MBL fold metallo-hydrolase n=1 Tax=Leptolyngbya sp. AN02str TaxID=3423363 RepID=UPI003D31E7AC
MTDFAPSAAPSILRPVLDRLFAFPPNRNTLGGTAYVLQLPEGNVLIDCPNWDDTVHAELQALGGVRWLVLTHRGAIAQVKEIQQATGCHVVIQEQEAYLLPNLTLTTFEQKYELTETAYAFWTPGHTPGSACLYWAQHGGVLFTGRHLLPNQQGEPVPLRLSKTFHWWRQLKQVQRLLSDYSPDTLAYICPGANTGFLRGKRAIAQAYLYLATLDFDGLRLAQPGL